MGKPDRLASGQVAHLPGLRPCDVTVCRQGGTTWVAVVGEPTRVAVAPVDPQDGLGEWETTDLSVLEGWPATAGRGRATGVATDGGSLIAVMRADPAVVTVAHTTRRTVRASISLVVPPWSGLAGRWDDPSSRGTGLVLLRGGRLLVVKQRRPRALVEFGPPGTNPRGLSRDDLLAPDEAWQPPLGEVTYHALGVWRLKGEAKKSLGDLGGVSAAPDGALWLLSPASAVVARLVLAPGLSRAGGSIRSIDEVYRLPKGTGKPAGVAAIGPERLVVVLDSPAGQGAAIVVDRPLRDEEE